MDTQMNVEQIINSFRSITEQGQMSGALGVVTLVIVLAVGVLNCFFGLKLFRVWVALTGVTVGLGLGYAITTQFTEVIPIVIGVSLVVGALLGVLAFKLYLLGVVLLCWLLGTSIAAVFIKPHSWVLMIVCIMIGVVIGILAINSRYGDHCIIWYSATTNRIWHWNCGRSCGLNCSIYDGVKEGGNTVSQESQRDSKSYFC
ncbi:MAG: hypothetical protein RR681_03805 [Lachnospiraceae bacterium]